MTRAAAGLALLALAAGCSDGAEAPRPAAAPSTAVTASPTPGVAPPEALVDGSVGGVPLRLEVAVTSAQREAGLRGRAVPPGTGMAFRYPGGSTVRFTMSGVDRPLVAVFARNGRALSVEQMTPCPGSVADCPTYGPPEPVDMVVEAAPASLPAARPGDAVLVPG